MSPKSAAAPLELMADPVRASDAVFVVALTAEGEVPLRVSTRPGEPPLVHLPGLQGSRPFDPLPSLTLRLREETGLEADELVVMSRYGIPTGERGRATILLAPRARVSPAPETSLVPLFELISWLSARKAEGARIDPRVWVGLLLAERHYPRWAQARLRAAIEHLRRGEARATDTAPRRSTMRQPVSRTANR